MKIIVTGGAGFIGSALIKLILAETSDTVINVDKLTYAGCLETLEPVAGTLGDLLEPPVVAVVGGVDRRHGSVADLGARGQIQRRFTADRTHPDPFQGTRP